MQIKVNAIPIDYNLELDIISIDTLYENISRLDSSSELQNYIAQIAEYEKNTYYLMEELYSYLSVLDSFVSPSKEEGEEAFQIRRLFHNFNNNYLFKRLNLKSNEIPSLKKEFNDNLYDIYSLDRILTHPKAKENYILIVTSEDQYLGHIYAWRDYNENRFYAQGIRTSLSNLIEKKYKGISYIIVDALISFAHKNGVEHVRIIEPFDIMVHVLEKYGFKKQEVWMNSNYEFRFNKFECLIPKPEYTLVLF